MKSFIGSGILFLPKAFSNGGFAFSSVVMLLMALLTQFTIMRLVRCRQLVHGSYSHIGHVAAGTWAKYAVDIALCLSQSGFCCVYVAFIARNVIQLLNVNSCWVSGHWLWLLIVLQLFLFSPLTWIRKIRYFALTSVIANVLIGLGLLAILIWCAVEWKNHPGELTVPAFNSSDFALFLGTAIYAFEGIGMIVSRPRLLSCCI